MECQVCFKNSLLESQILTLSCNCKFCSECITSWISSHLNKNLQKKHISIPCLSFSCEKALDIETIMTQLDLKHQEVLAEILIKHNIIHAKDLMSCPSCNYPGFVSNKWFCVDAYECSECKNQFNFPNAFVEIKAWLWILFYANRCPKCNIPFQKDEGCRHMTCTVCRHEFCYDCLGNFHIESTAKCNLRYYSKYFPIIASLLIAIWLINYYFPIVNALFSLLLKIVALLDSIEEGGSAYWILCFLIPNLVVVFGLGSLVCCFTSRRTEHEDEDEQNSNQKLALSLFMMILALIFVVIGIIFCFKGALLVCIAESIGVVITSQTERWPAIFSHFGNLFWKNLLVSLLSYPLIKMVLNQSMIVSWENLIGESLIWKFLLQNLLLFFHSLVASESLGLLKIWWYVPAVLIISNGYMMLMEWVFNIWTGLSLVLFNAAMGGVSFYCLKKYENQSLLKN